MARQLLVVTRLGVRFADRERESKEVFERRLNILRLASERFVRSFKDCVGWVIETDPHWYGFLCDEIAGGRIFGPENGEVVISRRGAPQESDDLDRLGLGGVPLLTVRLDSDDAYMSGAIDKALEASSLEDDGVLFDFPHGYLVRPSTGDVRYHSYLMQGPFLGFTTTGPDLARLHVDHGHAQSKSRGVVRIGGRAWVQTVHGNNIVTELETQDRRRQLYKLRRNWVLNPEGRTLRELPGFLSDLLPIRPAASGVVASTVAEKSKWAES